MTIQHSLITDPNIHEPKGISSATANRVYVSNGLGSGSWQFQPAGLYGEIYIDAGVAAQTLSAASAYAKLNPTGEWTAGQVKGLTTDATNGEIVLTQTGVYLVTFWVVLDTPAISATAKYNFRFALNGVTGNRTLSVGKYTNGAERLTLSATGFVPITSANTDLSIFVAGDSTSSSTNITVFEAGLTAVRVSE
jgi:hypothetical protein